MPITLEDIPAADETAVAPLRLWLWLLLLLLCLLAGALYGSLFWPAGKPVMTLAWWSRVLIWPLCGYAALLGVRLWWHDHCHNAVLDWNADRETLLAEETLRGQQPLYLYAIAQQCSLGSDGLAARLLAGDSALAATAIDGVGHVICARFPADFLAQALPEAAPEALPDDADGETFASDEDVAAMEIALALEEDAADSPVVSSAEAAPPHSPASWLPRVFVQLLQALLPQLQALRSPPRVLLSWPPTLAACDPLAHWQQACARCGVSLPPPDTTEQGLLLLDRCLEQATPLTLLVSVHGHETPPAGSGDAAVALLFGPELPPAAVDMPPLAWLNRPEQLGRAGNSVTQSLAYALRWSTLPASDVEQVWLAVPPGADQVAVLTALAELPLPTAAHPRIDVAAALGDVGQTAGWLSLAAAAEHAANSSKPQWVIVSDPLPVALVIEPLASPASAEPPSE